jgi:hypothetical protein
MITISIDQSTPQYRPGETISGTASWTELGAETEGIEIRLLWYTEGKGNQDLEVVESVPGNITHPTGLAKFEFTAPTRPFSFSGKLISLIWTIEVVLFPSRDGYREQVTLSHIGSEIKLDKSFEDSALKSSVKIGK